MEDDGGEVLAACVHPSEGFDGAFARMQSSVGALAELGGGFLAKLAAAQADYGRALQKVIKSTLSTSSKEKLFGCVPEDCTTYQAIARLISFWDKKAEDAMTVASAIERASASAAALSSTLVQQLNELKPMQDKLKRTQDTFVADVHGTKERYYTATDEYAALSSAMFKDMEALDAKKKAKLQEKKAELQQKKDTLRDAYIEKIEVYQVERRKLFIENRTQLFSELEKLEAHCVRGMAVVMSKFADVFGAAKMVPLVENDSLVLENLIESLSIRADVTTIFEGCGRHAPLPARLIPDLHRKDRAIERKYRQDVFDSLFNDACGQSFKDEKTARRQRRAARAASKKAGQTFTIAPISFAHPEHDDLIGVTVFLSPFKMDDQPAATRSNSDAVAPAANDSTTTRRSALAASESGSSARLQRQPDSAAASAAAAPSTTAVEDTVVLPGGIVSARRDSSTPNPTSAAEGASGGDGNGLPPLPERRSRRPPRRIGPSGGEERFLSMNDLTEFGDMSAPATPVANGPDGKPLSMQNALPPATTPVETPPAAASGSAVVNEAPAPSTPPVGRSLPPTPQASVVATASSSPTAPSPLPPQRTQRAMSAPKHPSAAGESAAKPPALAPKPTLGPKPTGSTGPAAAPSDPKPT